MRWALMAILVFAFASLAHSDIQSDRYAFIQKLIKMEVFTKIKTTESFVYVSVSSAFKDLEMEQKSQFANVVYAYYHTANKKYDTIYLLDSKTGKKYGVYSTVFGGLKIY